MVCDRERTKPVAELYRIDHTLRANNVAHVADCCAGRSSEVKNLNCIFGKNTKVAEEEGQDYQNFDRISSTLDPGGM